MDDIPKHTKRGTHPTGQTLHLATRPQTIGVLPQEQGRTCRRRSAFSIFAWSSLRDSSRFPPPFPLPPALKRSRRLGIFRPVSFSHCISKADPPREEGRSRTTGALRVEVALASRQESFSLPTPRPDKSKLAATARDAGTAWCMQQGRVNKSQRGYSVPAAMPWHVTARSILWTLLSAAGFNRKPTSVDISPRCDFLSSFGVFSDNLVLLVLLAFARRLPLL